MTNEEQLYIPDLADSRIAGLEWSESCLVLRLVMWDDRVVELPLANVEAVAFVGVHLQGYRLLDPGTDDPFGLLASMRRDGADTSRLVTIVLDGVDAVAGAIVVVAPLPESGSTQVK